MYAWVSIGELSSDITGVNYSKEIHRCEEKTRRFLYFSVIRHVNDR